MEYIVQRMPQAAIGIDVIVGFPGEGEAEFQETVSFLQDLPAAYFHVFTYSERAKTTALRIEDVVPVPVRKARNKVLRQMSLKKQWAHAARFQGQTRPVLLESEVGDDFGVSVGLHPRIRAGFGEWYRRLCAGKHCCSPTGGHVRRLGASPCAGVANLTTKSRLCIPTFTFLFQDLFGWEIPALKLVNTFGLMVALAFVVASALLRKELQRKQKDGVISSVEKKQVVGKGAGPLAWLSSAFLGMVLGWKVTWLLWNAGTLFKGGGPPQQHLFSGDGYPLLGVLGAAIFGFLRYREDMAQRLDEPREETVTVHPWERTGNITLVAAIGGVLGAKFFHLLEYPEEMVAFFTSSFSTRISWRPDHLRWFDCRWIGCGILRPSTWPSLYSLGRCHSARFDAGLWHRACRLSGQWRR